MGADEKGNEMGGKAFGGVAVGRKIRRGKIEFY